MATEKKIKGVIIPRHDSAKNWAKAVNFVPNDGELIIFSKDSDTDIARGYYLDDNGNPLSPITINGQSYPVVPADKVRFKFGNSVDNVNVLPFVTTDTDLTGYATEDWVKVYVAQNGGNGNRYASVTERRIVSGSEVELTDICPIQSNIVLKALKDDQPQASVEVQFYDNTNTIYNTITSDSNGDIPSEYIQYPYTKLKVVDAQYTIHGEYDAILDVESLDTKIDSKIEAAMEDYSPNAVNKSYVDAAVESLGITYSPEEFQAVFELGSFNDSNYTIESKYIPRLYITNSDAFFELYNVNGGAPNIALPMPIQVANPSSDLHAANKAYVDNKIKTYSTAEEIPDDLPEGTIIFIHE